MNIDKLTKLQQQVRIGGKGTARRKKKVVHRTATTDDKKLQSSLKKLSVNNIPGIEEVNMIKDDGTVIHFNNPKVQASLAANTFAITGHAENKQIADMLPGILNQLGAESLTHLKRLASNVQVASSKKGDALHQDGNPTIDEDDEVPDLVENFDEPSKAEGAAVSQQTEEEKKEEKPAEEEKKIEEVKVDEVKVEEVKGDEVKVEEVKQVEGGEEVKEQVTAAKEEKPVEE